MKKVLEKGNKTVSSLRYCMFIMMACLLAMNLTSCGDDDDDDIDSSLLIGTWYYSYYEDGEYYTDYLIISSDGTFVVYEDYEGDYGYWTLSGNTLKLTYLNDGDTFSATILTLTESVLIIQAEDAGETYTETFYR